MYDNCKKKRDELIKNLKVKMCPEDIDIFQPKKGLSFVYLKSNMDLIQIISYCQSRIMCGSYGKTSHMTDIGHF